MDDHINHETTKPVENDEVVEEVDPEEDALINQVTAESKVSNEDDSMVDGPSDALEDEKSGEEIDDDDVDSNDGDQTIEEHEMELQKLDQKRLKREKDLRKTMLQKIREEQQHEIEVAAEQSKKERFRFLLQQTEIFSHFVTGGKADSKKSGKDEPKTKTHRGQVSEKEEDAEILREALESDRTRVAHANLSCQPPCIKGGQMRQYQVDGLNWMINLYDHGINGILADEMGLGKTLQTISLLGYLKESRGIGGPHMILAPKSTLSNWMNEVKRWCPMLRPIKFHGNQEERNEIKKSLERTSQYDIIVLSYEIAIIEKTFLKKFGWRYLVIDEAHRIKNEKSILSEVVRSFHTQNRLLLTGTPLQNNIHELWALLNFLLPDVFNSSEDFEAWFQIGQEGVEVKEELVHQLHKVLRPFLLRRLKHDVEKSLPPKKETLLYIGLSKLQKDIYIGLLEKNVDIVNTATGKGDRVRLLNVMMQLRKICNHPYLFDNVEPGPPYTNGEHLVEASGKLVLLDKLLPRLKQSGSRVLVFSQMTRVLDILEDYFLMRKYEYCRIDGQTDGELRQSQVDQFNEQGSEKFAFLLSTRAGGLGLNLATADIVILFDSDWNPQADLQAMDRAHRIGQKKPVQVFRFVTEGTIEEKIIERAKRKLQLDALVIQQGRLVENKALKTNELRDMVKFGANEIIRTKGIDSITSEDINNILEKGAQRTAELDEQFKVDAQNILDFSSTSGKSIYEFEGQVYGKEKKEAPVHPLDNWVQLSKRERKANYSEAQYFREALRIHEPKKPGVTRPPRQPHAHDFHFYPQRLHDLLKREMDAWHLKVNTPDYDFPKGPDGKPLPIEFTEDDREEKDRLLLEGFGDWTRKDFQSYIKACEQYGRKQIAMISKSVEGKTEDQVRKYHSVFLKRYKEIADWEKLMKNIQRGEAKIQRLNEITENLQKKVARYRDPLHQMKIPYGSAKAGMLKSFTEEEDRFLILKCHELGYGNFDDIKRAVRESWIFRFDWFIKSRTSQEIGKRIDALCRLIEKENSELEEKESKGKKGKQSNGKKAATPKKTTQTPTRQGASPANGKKQTPPKGGKGSKTEVMKEEEEDAEHGDPASGDEESSSDDASSMSSSDEGSGDGSGDDSGDGSSDESGSDEDEDGNSEEGSGSDSDSSNNSSSSSDGENDEEEDGSSDSDDDGESGDESADDVEKDEPITPKQPTPKGARAPKRESVGPSPSSKRQAKGK